MATQAIWKTQIRFGRVAVPVKFFSAVEDRKIHFRLLHQKDLIPVVQRMVNPRTGQAVASEEIRRGYETEESDIVLLEEEELRTLEPENSQAVQISRFINSALINHQWYDRPYYLGPDGDSRPYFALARALEKGKKEGLARWNMRKKQYLGLLRAKNGFLMMMTLRSADEVIEVSAIPRPESRALEKPELKMAEQLVRALEGRFDPQAYEDEYRKRVVELVERKARGEAVIFRKVKERKPEVVSLTDVLKKSLRQVEKERKVA
jgi:DNA end-binding protein Ku